MEIAWIKDHFMYMHACVVHKMSSRCELHVLSSCSRFFTVKSLLHDENHTKNSHIR